MERREFLKLASMTAASSMVIDPAAQADTQPPIRTSKPNIIFVVSDQHRAGLTKREGYPLDTSPTLDSLAERGIDFTRAYCTTPLCVPSRTSMLTGRWPEAHRVRMNLDPKAAYFDKDLYQVAKEAGYRTGLAGKNHTYLTPDRLDFWREYMHDGPINRPHELAESAQNKQFDDWLKGISYNIGLDPSPFPLETQLPYRIVSDAIDFIDQSAQSGDSPFILQVGFPEPHDPEQVPAPYWNMFPPEDVPARCAGPEVLPKLGYRAQWLYGLQQSSFPTEQNWRRYKSNYLGMLRLLDDQLSRLVAHLKQKQILENTVIVYLADHGDYLMDYGLARKGVGLFESLTRIPMVWSGWGIHPSAAAQSAFTSMADVMPTLCEAMGAEIPIGVQGRSLWPMLEGKPYPSEEFRSIYAGVGLGGLYYEASDNVPYSIAQRKNPKTNQIAWDELNKVTQSGNMKMVRMGDWKLIYDMMGNGQMYHLASDTCELKNLFGDPSAAKEQSTLMAELLMWTIRTQDALPTGPQNAKYQTKWPHQHNWYAPYRH